MSQSNISHQIRNLENHLRTPLFHRSGRQMLLTEEGQVLLVQLTEGFQIVRQALSTLETGRDLLKIGAFPFLANEILAPHLDSLHKVLSDTDIRLYTQNEVELLTHVKPSERLDVVIRYAKSGTTFPGLVAQQLSPLALVPVIGMEAPEPTDPTDFLALPLARVLGPFDGWDLWLKTFAPGVNSISYALQTDSYHSAMLAVTRHEVACLAVTPFIQPWLAEQRLKALPQWQIQVPDYAAYLVYPRHHEGNPDFLRLTDWLLERWS